MDRCSRAEFSPPRLGARPASRLYIYLLCRHIYCADRFDRPKRKEFHNLCERRKRVPLPRFGRKEKLIEPQYSPSLSKVSAYLTLADMRIHEGTL